MSRQLDIPVKFREAVEDEYITAGPQITTL